MFEQDQFLHWCQKLKLSERAEKAIRHIRASAPSRLVGSGRGNVSGRYPSRKMGVTIQFESHKNELAHIQTLEHTDDVIEYYDQPPAIPLHYQSASGKRLGVWHTSDFFVIRDDSAGWEECKQEADLLRLTEQSPFRYGRDAAGQWNCPPGEKYATDFGLYYRLVSSADIDWVWQRNLLFLDDYLRAAWPPVNAQVWEAVRSVLAKEPGVTLAELFHRTETQVTRDVWYQLIAANEVYVDLHAAALSEPERVHVFLDQAASTAYQQVVQSTACTPWAVRPQIHLRAGASFRWDGQCWTIVNLGEAMIGLLDANQSFTELPRTAFEKLLAEGRLTNLTDQPTPVFHAAAKELLAAASHAALATANQRAGWVRAYLKGELTPNALSVTARTLYRWVNRYRTAQETLGSGYLGLLPQPKRGNAQDKLPTATKALLDEFIRKDYETLKQKNIFAVYAAFQRACEEQGISPASYKTFCTAVRQRPQEAQTRQRQGPRAAYQKQAFYWELTQTTPRHGQRPFEIVHIDHTELDVELICSLTGRNLGRPWATFLTDAFSRRFLAVYLTFDPPSYRACMMVLRECVRRWSRLPQIVVVDGGLEFAGVYFETLLARYECTKKTRPPAAARFGSVCERLFGTANTQFIHNLQGNTQIMRQVRQVTQSVNPQKHAIWTLETLFQYLCEWAYEVYDTLVHPALGQSPRDTYDAGMQRGGQRLHRLIPYDADFRLFTLPTTRKGTAHVVPSHGVKINHLYYWNEAFRAPDVERTQVAVRFDPSDAGTAWAFVAQHWVECFSEHYAVFHQRSERELQLASAELRQRNNQHAQQFSLTAKHLAQFLASVEAEELLLRQRLADRGARALGQILQSKTGVTVEPTRPNEEPSPERLAVPTATVPYPPKRLETYQRF